LTAHEHIQERTRTVTWGDPLLSAQAATTMSGIDFLQAMIDGQYPPPPIAVLLNFSLAEVSPGRAVFEVEPAEYHYNPIGVVHGGLIATLADSALGCAVQSTLPAGVGYTTLELHVNLTRALTMDTGRVRCEANVLHVGRRVATAEAKVTDASGKLYGHATTTCIILSQ
jgi:uncharacterized protein (TIGR00369 family)